MKLLVYDSDVCIYQLCVDRFIQVFKKKQKNSTCIYYYHLRSLEGS